MHYYERLVAGGSIFTVTTTLNLMKIQQPIYLSFVQKILDICSTLTASQPRWKVKDIGKLPAIVDLNETLKQLLGMKTKYTNKYDVQSCQNAATSSSTYTITINDTNNVQKSAFRLFALGVV